MSNRKITDMVALTAPASDDVLPIVDISEAAAVDKNKKISIEELFKGVPDGTAAAPSIAFESDDDSGIFLAGTNTVGITTAGTQRVTVDGSGNVTIDGDLTVNGATTTIDTTSLIVEDKNIEMGVVSTPTNTTADGGGITLKGATDKTITWVDSTGCWTFNQPTNFNNHVRIDSSGNVGIGTSSPGANLHVSSSSDTIARITSADGSGAFLDLGDASDPDGGRIVYDSGSNLALYTASSERLRIDSSGNVGIGITPTAPLHVGGTIQSQTGSSVAQMYTDGGSANFASVGAYPAIFLTNGAERLRIDSSGNVGIGVTAPGNANEGAGLQVRKYIDRNATYYTPDGHYAGSFGYTNNTQDKVWLSVDSEYAKSSAVSAGLFLSAFHQDAGGSGCGSTIKNLKTDNALTFSTVATASGTGSPAVETERLRIDGSGRLLVGTSSARANFFNTTLTAGLQVEGTGGSTARAGLSVVNNDSSNNPAYIVLGRSASATLGSNTTVASGDWIGSLSFQGADGSELVEAASIQAWVDAAPGANDMPGRLVFSTTADGASSPTERMRIDSAGSFLLGTTQTRTGQSSLSFESYNAGIFIRRQGSGSFTHIIFTRNTDTTDTTAGSISTTGTATSYNTSSDYRLKENIVPLTGAVDRIKELKPSKFNFIVDPDKTVDGFIAHEAQEVVPECVTGTKDEVDADGNPVYQGIDQSKLVPLLTAALQETLAKIETLEARLTAAGI